MSDTNDACLCSFHRLASPAARSLAFGVTRLTAIYCAKTDVQLHCFGA